MMETENPETIPYGKKNPFPAELLVNRKLNKEGAFKDTRHIELSLRGSGFTYEVGDVLATYPLNDPDHVDEILSLLPFRTEKSTVELKGGPEMPLRDALIQHFDLRTVNKTVLKKWAAKTYHPYLQAAMEDDAEIAEILDGIEVIDLLYDFPREFKDGQEFVDVLRKQIPRLYSIASSLNAHPDEVHLTVAKVEYQTRGRERKGVASTFLCDRLPVGEKVMTFIQVSKHFRLPEDPAKDVVMVGPGTGIAPFRAFLEERAIQGAQGRNWLFFGNPHRGTDFFYEDEFRHFEEKGVLHRMDLAWSRDQAHKIYVQDKIREAREELWRWIDGGAHFYVCGDATRMAGDVDEALREAIREGGGFSPEEADAYVEQMKKDHRYQRDVY